ncbi:ABC transporter ATP-binding protein [Nocardioides lentus]|uniref:ABC transporter ATP-binding protein n=1 Tax=Nocardioides lentus TaxID=338077 RepID=A0ABN2NVS7_9ACTN
MSGPRPGALPTSTGAEAARTARRLLGGHRRALAVSAAAFTVAGLAGLVAPLVLGRIVDLAESGGTTSSLVVAAALIAVAAVVGAVATTVAVTWLARAGEPALAELREEVLDRALHLDAGRLEEAGAGDLLSRVGDDVRLVQESLRDAVPTLMTSVVAIVFTGAGLFALDWRLGLAGLGAVPAYVWALRWYLPQSGPRYRAEREANGERAEALVVGVHASGTLRAHGLAADHQRRVEAASWRAASVGIDVVGLFTRFGNRTNRAELVGLLLVLVVGFLGVRADAVTVGEVTAAALLFHRLFNPVGAVVFLFDEVQSAGASLTRLVGLAEMPRPAAPAPRAVADASLRLRGVGHSYREGRPVLVAVDADVAPGERVAVVGATGAGKTTLAAIAAGHLRPTTGTVELGGVPLDAAQADGRLPVAVVTQEVHTYAGTVRDNLTLAAPDADDARLVAVLDAVGARGWVEALPDGLDTVVGDGAHPLTPAQAQHLALARVPLADPLVVVLDEATAEAGSAGARDLERAAAYATRGRTTLTVAHRLTQAAAADRVWVMADGRVVESGTHADLVAAGGTYADLWAAWSRR